MEAHKWTTTDNISGWCFQRVRSDGNTTYNVYDESIRWTSYGLPAICLGWISRRGRGEQWEARFSNGNARRYCDPSVGYYDSRKDAAVALRERFLASA